jgi:hypothetical protein
MVKMRLTLSLKYSDAERLVVLLRAGKEQEVLSDLASERHTVRVDTLEVLEKWESANGFKHPTRHWHVQKRINGRVLQYCTPKGNPKSFLTKEDADRAATMLNERDEMDTL